MFTYQAYTSTECFESQRYDPINNGTRVPIAAAININICYSFAIAIKQQVAYSTEAIAHRPARFVRICRLTAEVRTHQKAHDVTTGWASNYEIVFSYFHVNHQ